MRVTLTAFGLTVIDLSVLEPDEPEADTAETAETADPPGSPTATTERSDSNYETARIGYR